MRRLRFVVSGGGTGGHIYPALAIAGGLAEFYPGAEILYIGSKNGMEAEIVPKEDIQFAGVNAAGLKRKLSLENISVLGQACLGFAKSLDIIRKWRPDAVIGTGGYVCGPVVMAAAMNGIPALIHEQNAFPGITNRILARVAGCVAVTFADSLKYFPANARTILTGLPVRQTILAADREESLKHLGLGKGKLILLSFGGSRGAGTINKTMAEVIQKFAGYQRLHIFHITGKQGYQEFMDEVTAAGVELGALSNVTVKPYMYDMHDILAAADLVISRAGATTLAELTALGLPSILVPYPYAAENHQEYNARALEREGAAVVILDRELNGQLLYDCITGLIDDAGRMAAMRTASKKLGKTSALQDIVACVDALIQ